MVVTVESSIFVLTKEPKCLPVLEVGEKKVSFPLGFLLS